MHLSKILIFLLIFPLENNSIKVFEFIENNDKTGPSTVEIEVPLPTISDNLTICSSHKQLQSNFQTLRIYTIYEDEGHNSPWFAIGFWGNELWATLNTNDWINLIYY